MDEPIDRSHYPAIILGRDGLIHASFSHFAADGRKSIKHAVFNEAWIRQ